MNEKVRKNLAAGMNRVKWVASYVAERTKAETSAAKLYYESSKLEGRMDDIYKEIGKRVIELKEKPEKDEVDLLKDPAIQNAFEEIKMMKESSKDYKKQARDINNISE